MNILLFKKMGNCGSLVDKGKKSLKGILSDEKQYGEYSDSAFDKVDTNKNGYIEKDELNGLIQELITKLKKDTRIPEDKVQSALELMDTDGDGRISKEEFRKTSRTKLLAAIS